MPAIGTVGLPLYGSPTFAIEVTNAAPNAIAALFVAGTQGSTPLGSCDLLLGSPVMPTTTVGTDPSGRGDRQWQRTTQQH